MTDYSNHRISPVLKSSSSQVSTNQISTRPKRQQTQPEGHAHPPGRCTHQSDPTAFNTHI